MTCEQVRDLLPDALLGSLEGPDDLEVRRHLRGCTPCREERAHLEDGIAALSRAAHDREPPAELRDHVLATLSEEWTETDAEVPPGAPAIAVAARASRARGRSWLVAASVTALLVAGGSLAWGASQHRRATLAQADAQSYRVVLSTLGGRDFRVGSLTPSGDAGVSGNVLLYEGDPSAAWSSWALVLLDAPGQTGTATATLLEPGGGTLTLPTMQIAADGQASTLLVIDAYLSSYDRLTITGADGTVLATATIRNA